MQVNSLEFCGYVGRDAEVVGYNGVQSFTKFSLCHTQKGKDGAADKSTWVDVICFGKTGELARSIKKGDNIYAAGNLSIKDTEKDGKSYRNVSLLARTIGKVAKFDQSTTSEANPDPVDIPF
jgi:single-stranded DNA-binding protein